MNSRLPQNRKTKAALLGLAFDAEDDQKRITRGPNFFLAGGSSETHGHMQETAVKLNEHLDRKGKQLADVSANELRDIMGDIHGKWFSCSFEFHNGSLESIEAAVIHWSKWEFNCSYIVQPSLTISFDSRLDSRLSSSVEAAAATASVVSEPSSFCKASSAGERRM